MEEEILKLGEKVDDYLRLYIQKDIPITREQADEINEYKCELKNLIEQQDRIIREAREYVKEQIEYLKEQQDDFDYDKTIKTYCKGKLVTLNKISEILDRNVK